MSIDYIESPDYRHRARHVMGLNRPAVFLAGGITGCPRWHDDALVLLRSYGTPLTVLNPNRENFPIHDPRAGREQVWWEQDHLLMPTTVTTQPIALFELGQILNPATLATGRQFVIGADPGYPRCRDVELMMDYHVPGQPLYSTLAETVSAAVAELVRP